MTQFTEYALSPELLRGVEDLGFVSPTPIQEKTIPIILESTKDIIGLAQTGTGKTAAFGLPLLHKIDLSLRQPQGLILAPTRELCLQICRDLKSFSAHIPALRTLAVYGGADAGPQIEALQRGVHVVVATPGRMNDLLNKRRKANLSNIRMVVLDEADEMLDMGFKDDLDAILSQTPEERSTYLFSATMPREMQKLCNDYMSDPEEIRVGERNSGTEQVDHIYHVVHPSDRYAALKRVVDFRPNIYGIVFCRTRKETKDISQQLINDGYNADALHGDLSQSQREYIMQKFRQKNLQLLVATDVAARGLDVQGISHVVHYNLPDDSGIYTHRSGRTGRAGNTGTSIAIINNRERHRIRSIEREIGRKFTFAQVPQGKNICENQLLHLIEKICSAPVDHQEIDRFFPLIAEKLEHLERDELIKMFLSLEFEHFLSYYKNARDLTAPERQNQDRRNDSRRPAGKSSDHTKVRINLGMRDGVTPKSLISFIAGRLGRRQIPLGKIDIAKNVSFVEVPRHEEQNVLTALRKSFYKNRKISAEPQNSNPRREYSGSASRNRDQRERSKEKAIPVSF